MRWSHIKENEWAALERRHAEGLPTKPLDERPEISAGEQVIWEYFWALRHFVSPPAFGGVNPISVVEIDAWLKLFNPVFLDEEDKHHVLDVIVRLDRKFMTLVTDKNERRKNKETKKPVTRHGRHTRRASS